MDPGRSPLFCSAKWNLFLLFKLYRILLTMVLLPQMHGTKSLITYNELHESTVSRHTQKMTNGEKREVNDFETHLQLILTVMS